MNCLESIHWELKLVLNNQHDFNVYSPLAFNLYDSNSNICYIDRQWCQVVKYTMSTVTSKKSSPWQNVITSHETFLQAFLTIEIITAMSYIISCSQVLLWSLFAMTHLLYRLLPIMMIVLVIISCMACFK